MFQDQPLRDAEQRLGLCPHWFRKSSKNRILTQLSIFWAANTRIQEALRSGFLTQNMLMSISTPRVLLERRWLQEIIETFMMLNKRRRWHHSSRVKLPLVNKSAN